MLQKYTHCFFKELGVQRKVTFKCIHILRYLTGRLGFGPMFQIWLKFFLEIYSLNPLLYVYSSF